MFKKLQIIEKAESPLGLPLSLKGFCFSFRLWKPEFLDSGEGSL